jgi:outer membrane cobalamin receptor
MNRAFGGSVVATLLACTSTVAIAQTEAPARETGAVAMEDANDIVVTAQKVEQRIEDVPLAVTAVTQESRKIGCARSA